MPVRRTHLQTHGESHGRGEDSCLALSLFALDRPQKHKHDEESDAATDDPKNGFPLSHCPSLPKPKGNVRMLGLPLNSFLSAQ